jgi:hypothetical protein
MSTPPAPPRRSFLQRLLSRAGENFFYSASIDLVEGSPRRVVLSMVGRPFTADAVTREIRSEDRVVARFEAVEAVVITRLLGKGPLVWWLVNLSLRHGGEVFVGRTSDDLEASVAAARLATVIGVEVRAPESELGEGRIGPMP